MIRRPPKSTLFPSPTLSRSDARRACTAQLDPLARRQPGNRSEHRQTVISGSVEHAAPQLSTALHDEAVRARLDLGTKRSEEHTSELQSQSNLVCRLLLEKKK